MQTETEAARRRNMGQTLRKLARIQREVQGAAENCEGVFDITREGVSLSPGLFRACFSRWRREPLEGNPHAGALLTACWGGVRFFTYASPGAEGGGEAGRDG